MMKIAKEFHKRTRIYKDRIVRLARFIKDIFKIKLKDAFITRVNKFLNKIIKSKEYKVKNREFIANFSLALILFVILTQPKLHNEKRAGKKRNIETLHGAQPTPWLLLAIIWYLVMIRESSGAGSRSAAQPKKKKKTIANNGIIFAYAT